MSAIDFGFSTGGVSAACLAGPLSFAPDAGADAGEDGVAALAGGDGATMSGAGVSLAFCGGTGFSCDTVGIATEAKSTGSINSARRITRPARIGVRAAVDSVLLLEFRTRTID
jgi:hypothetical protein